MFIIKTRIDLVNYRGIDKFRRYMTRNEKEKERKGKHNRNDIL